MMRTTTGTVIVPTLGPGLRRAARALARSGVGTVRLDLVRNHHRPEDLPRLAARLIEETDAALGPNEKGAYLGRGLSGTLALWTEGPPRIDAVAAIDPHPALLQDRLAGLAIPALLLVPDRSVGRIEGSAPVGFELRVIRGAEAERVAARWLAERLGVGRRRLPALAGSALLGLAAVVFTPLPSGATVTSSVAGADLTVTSDTAADRMEVTCGAQSGNVKVNGDNPGTGPFPCADLENITMVGGGGDDTVDLDAVGPSDFGSLERVRIEGGGGADLVRGSDIPEAPFSPEVVLLGGGADTLLCGQGCDCVIGGGGPDSLVGGPGPDDFDAGSGNDTVKAGPGPDDYLYGQAGNDLLNGGPGGDLFFSGGQGSDTVLGGPGDDLDVQGDEEDDTVSGGPGSDDVFGGTDGGADLGDDLISGGLSSGDTDTVTAGEGTDTLQERANVNMFLRSGAAVTLSGGGGTVFVSDVPERVRLFGGPSNKAIDASDYAFGGVFLAGLGGHDTLTGTAQKDALLGGPGNDLARAGGGRDTAKGGAGNDRLLGQGDPDTLFGNRGNDTLRGGPGRDALHGGPGQDVEDQ
jgi:Ca2+-binding RTX toxin-like protein